MNNKNFKLITTDDFIIYLNFLIILMKMELDKYHYYLLQIDDKINKINLTKENNANISPNDYNDYNDKFRSVSHYILNLVGDDTKGAMSYKRFRRTLEKNAVALSLNADPLDKKIIKLLDYFNTIRNWGLHIPESLLNAHLISTKKEFNQEPRGIILTHLNPIGIAEYNYYEGKYLLDLYDENKIFYKKSIEVFHQMKKDYSNMIGKHIKIEKVTNAIKRFEIIKNNEISLKMQMKTYKSVDF